MPRYVKCRHCNETELFVEREEKMEIVTIVSEKTGKSKNTFYHKEKCWINYQKEQEFIIGELNEKDNLNDVIKEIYNIQYQIPPRIWSLLQDLRNGTNRYQKFFKRKYKEGVPYDVLAQAYRMSKDGLHWAKLNKRFKSLEEEMRYGVIVMQSKIEDARRKIKLSEQSQKFSDAKESDVVRDILDNREVDFKKNKPKEKELDLSDILGDD